MLEDIYNQFTNSLNISNKQEQTKVVSGSKFSFRWFVAGMICVLFLAGSLAH